MSYKNCNTLGNYGEAKTPHTKENGQGCQWPNPLSGDAFPGLSPKTLANWNSLGRGPKPHKFGRKVNYTFSELVCMFEKGSEE